MIVELLATVRAYDDAHYGRFYAKLFYQLMIKDSETQAIGVQYLV